MIGYLIAFAAGIAARQFWSSHIRPFLFKEAHVVVSVAGKDAQKILAEIKAKLKL
jgi:hypothetical protein